MTALNKLIGKAITKVTYNHTAIASINEKRAMLIESQTTILFEDYTLVIYNPFVIHGTDTEISLSILEGLMLISCEERPTEIVLTLEANVKLVIDLRDESYKGPEALSLYGPNNLIVVWN